MMGAEKSYRKRRLYARFGVAFCVWFCGPALLHVIGGRMSTRWRFKVMRCVLLSWHAVALSGLGLLLWPSRKRATIFQVEMEQIGHAGPARPRGPRQPRAGATGGGSSEDETAGFLDQHSSDPEAAEDVGGSV